MSDIGTRAEKWFADNVEYLNQHFTKVQRSSNLTDPLRGAIIFALETQTLVASITIWNKGDVAVLVLRAGSQEPTVLDDRVLNSDEDIAELLDGYIQSILRFE